MTTPLDTTRPEAKPASGSPPANVMLGIGLKVLSVCIFVGMAGMIKGAEGVPPGELVFFRSLFAIVPVLLFLAWRRELVDGFKTSNPLGHVWRGFVGVCAMGLNFYGLTQLPLPDSITINYATPLLIVVFSAVFLRERVKLYRWTAVLVGLVGVLIIMWPRLSLFSGGVILAGGAALGALATLTSSAFAAAAQLQVRRLTRTEGSATIVIYFSLTCTVASLLTLPFGWVWPSPTQAALLITAGLAGGVAQILMTESYRQAPLSIVAPFEYSSLILGLIVGYIVFHDIPTPEMLVGGFIVTAAGIFIIYREHRLGLQRAAAERLSTLPG